MELGQRCLAAIRDYQPDCQWCFPSCLNSALKHVVLENEGCALDEERSEEQGEGEKGLVRDEFATNVVDERWVLSAQRKK